MERLNLSKEVLENRKRGKMQIVIEIPEETYTHLRNGGSIGASLLIEDAIKNGTPLPKDHGKLVDISKINEDRTDDDCLQL